MISVFPDSFSSSSLVEILRTLVNTKQTGYLKMKEGEKEGFIAVENGVIINAKVGSYTALHALFQFVGWRDAKFDFHGRPLPTELARDLAVYDADVLITGVAFKVDEMTLLQQAIPSPEAILQYTGDAVLKAASIEVTAADLGLLGLVDGQRTVREIAEKVMLSPTEVARSFARFRLVGVLVPVTKKTKSGKSIAVAA